MSHTIAEHFVGRSPHVREIYNMIVATASEFGSVKEDPKKTSIHLNRRSAFAGIATRREFLILTVKAKADIDDPRIAKSEQASAKRWYHYMKIKNTCEIDHGLIWLLRDSYEISG